MIIAVEDNSKSLYSKFKDEFWITDIQKHPSKNYILLMIGIVVSLALIGNYFASLLTIEPIELEHSKDLEFFSINTTM